MVKSVIVTIDGPAGAGKGTLARRLAQVLDFHYLEIGCYYRAIAAKVLESSTDPIQIAWHLEGTDLERADLYSVDVTALTPKLSEDPKVREAVKPFLLERAARPPGSIVDGRSGMYVFHDADVKIFLTANIHERVNRRYAEYRQKGKKHSFAAVRHEIEQRDAKDRDRLHHPLLTDTLAEHTPGLTYVDSTSLNAEEVFQTILALCREKLDLAAA